MIKTYRSWVKDDDLVSFRLIVKETDLMVRADRDLMQEAEECCRRCRTRIENYIQKNRIFAESLKPVEVKGDVPPIVRTMVEASARVGVGPMAAVAGAIAQFIGRDLLKLCHEVIVENGGGYLHEDQ